MQQNPVICCLGGRPWVVQISLLSDLRWSAPSLKCTLSYFVVHLLSLYYLIRSHLFVMLRLTLQPFRGKYWKIINLSWTFVSLHLGLEQKSCTTNNRKVVRFLLMRNASQLAYQHHIGYFCDNLPITNNGNPYRKNFFKCWSDYNVCKAAYTVYPKDNIYTPIKRTNTYLWSIKDYACSMQIFSTFFITSDV